MPEGDCCGGAVDEGFGADLAAGEGEGLVGEVEREVGEVEG